MIINFIIISLATYNFGSLKFNSTNETFTLPHIIFPFYSYQSDFITLSNQFLNESSSDPSYVAASINCDKYTTLCSLFEFYPGSMYISYPPHKHLQKSNREATYQNAKQLASDITVQGLYREITTIEQIQKIANECPFYALFARSNAGDLEVKLPIVEQIAQLYSHRNVRFAFVTEFALYEKFARHPLTSFVFISPSLKHSTQRGDFTLENLLEFVKKYEQPVWKDLIDTPPSQVALTVVGRSLNDTKQIEIKSTPETNKFENDDIDEDDIEFSSQKMPQTENDDTASNFVNEFKKYQTQYPMVFVDNQKDSMRAMAICESSLTCIAAVDFKKFRSIVIPENSTNEEVLKYLREFNSLWSKKKWTDKASVLVRNLAFLNFKVFCSCGSVFLFLLGLTGLFFVDKKREIPDERKGILTKPKTK